MSAIKKKIKRIKSRRLFALPHARSLWTSYIKNVKKKKLNQIKNVNYKPWFVLEFLENMQWHVGESLNKKNQNLKVISKYAAALRHNLILYNTNELVLSLRKLLHFVSYRVIYKKKILINLCGNSFYKKNNDFEDHAFENSKRFFMATKQKWKGGVLTNFKLIAKSLLKRKKETVAYTRPPKFPSFFISTKENHWAWNEFKLMNITSYYLINSRNLQVNFFDFLMAMNNRTAAIIRFTGFLEMFVGTLKQKNKLFYRKKILRSIRRRARIKSNRNYVIQAFRKVHKITRGVQIKKIKKSYSSR